MRSAGSPVLLIGSPVNVADRLIGSPITWHHTGAGHLLLMRQDAGGQLADRSRALVLVVGGDSLTALALQLEGRPSPRPTTLDLLWTVRRLHVVHGEHVSRGGGAIWGFSHVSLALDGAQLRAGCMWFTGSTCPREARSRVSVT